MPKVGKRVPRAVYTDRMTEAEAPPEGAFELEKGAEVGGSSSRLGHTRDGGLATAVPGQARRRSLGHSRSSNKGGKIHTPAGKAAGMTIGSPNWRWKTFEISHGSWRITGRAGPRAEDSHKQVSTGAVENSRRPKNCYLIGPSSGSSSRKTNPTGTEELRGDV